VCSIVVVEFYGEKRMYKQILLTEQETNLLLKTIDFFQTNQSENLKEINNLHIIKRHLMGTKPIQNSLKSVLKG
jgi:hypothetical protein